MEQAGSLSSGWKHLLRAAKTDPFLSVPHSDRQSFSVTDLRARKTDDKPFPQNVITIYVDRLFSASALDVRR